jgi:mannitol-specific phosphotransferase system IIBC component
MANPTPAQVSQMRGAAVAAQVGQVVGDVVVGLLQNKTQKDFNNAKIAVLKEDSRLKALSQEQRQALDEKVAKAVNDVAKLRVYEETLATIGVGVIDSNASIYREKLKNDAIAKTRGYFIIGGIAALIFGGALYIYKKNN